jgi:hypothetical protein
MPVNPTRANVIVPMQRHPNHSPSGRRHLVKRRQQVLVLAAPVRDVLASATSIRGSLGGEQSLQLLILCTERIRLLGFGLEVLELLVRALRS